MTTEKKKVEGEPVSAGATGKKKLVWSWDDPQFKMNEKDIAELTRKHMGTFRVTVRPKGG